MLLKNGQRLEGNSLPKLKKIQVFELTGMYQHFDPKNQKIKKANTLSLPTTYSIYEPGENDTTEYRYAVSENSYQTEDGKQAKKYFPHKVIIAGGTIIVKTNQPDLYQWLLNHPGNEANGGKIFKQRDIVKQAEQSVSTKKLVFDAQTLILGGPKQGLSDKELRKLLLSLGNNEAMEMEIELVKQDLLKRAEVDPAGFILSAKSSDKEYKILVVDALKNKVIKVDEKSGVWSWAENSKGAGEIVKVPQGQDRAAWFLGWISETDSSGVAQEIERSLKELRGAEREVKQPA